MGLPVVPPESQEAENWCWAACLIWQGRMVNRQVFSHQTDCAMAYEKYWVSNNPDKMGQVSRSEMKKILRDSRFKLSVIDIPGNNFSYEMCAAFTKHGPFIIGFDRYDGSGKHVNAIYEIDGGGNVYSMDPGGYMVGYSTGVYQGIFANRSLFSYKQSSRVVCGFFEQKP